MELSSPFRFNEARTATANWLIPFRTNVFWTNPLLLPAVKEEAAAARSNSIWACIAWGKMEYRSSFSPYALDSESLACYEEDMFLRRPTGMVAQSSRLVKRQKKLPLQSGRIAGQRVTSRPRYPLQSNPSAAVRQYHLPLYVSVHTRVILAGHSTSHTWRTRAVSVIVFYEFIHKNV